MGKFFSDDVETALQYIYYDNRLRLHRGQEGFDLLVKASEAGDGDADCVLARCLSGYQYVWPGHHFPVDDKKVTNLIHRSIERGSALGILVVYLIRRLSMDYSWVVAIVAGAVTQLVVIFMGDFLFSVSIPVGPMILSLAGSALLAVVYDFFIFSVDYTRTEYVQFEDDDYYYYVKAVPKMTVATPEFKVQKINARKSSDKRRE